mgnify:CR=1 FL=1
MLAEERAGGRTGQHDGEDGQVAGAGQHSQSAPQVAGNGLALINAEIQRVRAREQQQERKNETRRKVLVGAMILAKVNSSEWPEDRLMAAMDAYLERDHDRALFGLPPRQKDEPG